MINPDNSEGCDRARALAHIGTPWGVASVSHNAPTDLIVAMVLEAARQVGGVVEVAR